MEIETDNHFNHTNNDDYDVLSLRDLQMYDHTPTSSTHSSPSPRTSSGQQLFEFFPNLSNRNPIGTEDIVFCGKVIPGSVNDNDLNNQYQNLDYLKLVGSSSFRFPDRPIEHVIPIRSVSDREIGSVNHAVKFSSSVKKVNITALTSMSSKSRRRLFMFGPVKFKPEMEMSAIKERQGRRAPSRMFTVAGSGESGKEVVGGEKNTVKTLRCRSRLNTVFERSLACLRL